MKRYTNYQTEGMNENDIGEWVKYSEVKADLEIVYKSLIAKDYIAAIEILGEILEGE